MTETPAETITRLKESLNEALATCGKYAKHLNALAGLDPAAVTKLVEACRTLEANYRFGAPAPCQAAAVSEVFSALSALKGGK